MCICVYVCESGCMLYACMHVWVYVCMYGWMDACVIYVTYFIICAFEVNA